LRAGETVCAGSAIAVKKANFTVYAAIAANVVIAVTKFVAAAIGGSSAMISEGVHSVVDTGDGLLLLLGLHLSTRAPTPRHPYGHGAEVYFWSTIVAMSIFGMGGCVSIYQGVRHLENPQELSNAMLGLVVLGIAFVFEGISWLVAQREFRKIRRGRGVWETIQRSKDPTTFVVVLEDSAALLGIVAAAAGLSLAHWLHMPAFDAIASIVIGILLVIVGIVLGRETWSLLLGESASRDVVESIRALALQQPGVLDARAPRTMHIAPQVIHVDLDLAIDPTASAVEVSRRIEAAVHDKHPDIRRVSFRFPEWPPP
jgi:cation diffusion facilitator family transporter